MKALEEQQLLLSTTFLLFVHPSMHLNSINFMIISYSQALQQAKIKHQQLKECTLNKPE